MRNFSAVIILWMPSLALLAQDYNAVLPPSPTAAAMAKYGEIPVSFYTGTPNVSIPLLTLKGTELELPLSLSYMARGAKVEDNASWVGLGWSLNGNGVVTRVVRGLPDGSRPRVHLPLPTDFDELKEVMDDIEGGFLDLEPDIYHFNFNGHSGSFMLDEEGKVVIEGFQDLKITFDPGFTTFTVVSGNGTRYIFENNWEETGGQPTGVNLAKIISPTTKDTISFSYTSERYSYHSPKRLTKWVRPNGNSGQIVKTSPDGTIYPLVVTNARRLIGITTNFGLNAEFIADTAPRADFPDPGSNLTPRMLKRIRMYTTPGETIRNIVFEHEVVETDEPYLQLETYDPAPSQVAYLNKRVYLKSVQELSGDMSLSVPPHRFSYLGRTAENKDLLPHRLSSSQDHWGYFNGYSNTSLLPAYSGPFGEYDDDFALADNCPINYAGMISLPSFSVGGANRNPRAPYMLYGSLKSIQYPTGGRTDFEFEPHKYAMDVSRGGTVTKEVTATAQAHVSGESTNIVATDTLQTSLATTFEFEIGVECWDYSNNVSVACSHANADVNYQLYGNSIVCLRNSNDEEVLAIKWLAGGFGLYRNGVSDPLVGLIEPDENGFVTEAFTATLPYDTYVLKTTRDSNGERDIFGWLYHTTSVPINILDQNEHKMAGGLRLRSFTSFDEQSDTAVHKTYSYEMGALINSPKNKYVYSPGGRPEFLGICVETPHVNYGDPFPYLEVSCGPSIALGSTQGSPIGYRYVTENTRSNGRTVYEFATPFDFMDDLEPAQISVFFYRDDVEICVSPDGNWWDDLMEDLIEFGTGEVLCDSTYLENNTDLTTYTFDTDVAWPFFEKNDRDWKTGSLLRSEQFNSAGAMIYSKQHEYDVVVKETIGSMRHQTLRTNEEWQYGLHYSSIGTVRLKTTTETFENALEKVTSNFYESENHNYITRQETLTSDSVILRSEFKYPDDYSMTDANHPVTKMKAANLHMTEQPIETRMFRNGVSIGGAITQKAVISKSGGGNFVASKAAFRLKEGLSSTQAQWSSDPTIPDTTVLVKDAQLSWNGKANMVGVLPSDKRRVSYVWQAGSASPIAKAINATSPNVFTTSFEDSGTAHLDAQGNNVARTGRKVHASGSYSFPTSFSPTASGMKMSYWYWYNNQWNHSGVIAYQSTINSTGTKLDEIRAFPSDSQITTYTYDVGVGMTSTTDTNGSTTYFEYDKLGRLKTVRDKDKNLIKSQSYQYFSNE